MAAAARSIFSGKGSFLGMIKTNPEVLPVVSAAAIACSGAIYCLTRSAMRPDVVWTGRQDEPWNRVNQNKNTRFQAFSHMPDKKSIRVESEDLRGRL